MARFRTRGPMRRFRSNPRKSLWLTASRSGIDAQIASIAPGAAVVSKFNYNFGTVNLTNFGPGAPVIGMEDPTLTRIRGSFSLAANFGAGGDWFDFRVGIIPVGYIQATAAEMPNPYDEASDSWLWYKTISGISSAGVGSLWNAAGSQYFEVDAKSKRRLQEGDDLAFVMVNHPNSQVNVYCHYCVRLLVQGARKR